MSNSTTGGGLRAYLKFLAALVFFFAARSMAGRGALAWVGETWAPLLEQLLLVLLLLAGYAALGMRFDREEHPVTEQGLPRRRGFCREAGMGLALGWGLALACLVPMAIFGGVAVSLTTHLDNWGWLAVEVVFFALAALAEEIGFRGYGFQRFVDAVGPTGASLVYAAFYAILQSRIPGSSRATLFVAVAFSLLLSNAYLRTRALWVSWGVNFGWKASRALLFGLAVNGVNSHSPVVQGDPLGPFWLSGGAFGLEASWFAFSILLLSFPVLFRLTADLNFLHNTPVFEPGGVAVDLDAAARAQHEAAVAPVAPAAPQLVQILPAAPIATAAPAQIAAPEQGTPPQL
jgi:hypothetical protein